jgi:hypothetical protein
MKEYHRAWLDAHPDRTADWLKRMLAEGFQVHHIDGDHSNNHPANLALIENVDHLRLHGMFGLARPGIRIGAIKGGKARMSKMSKKERSAHQSMAAKARWKAVRKRRRVAQARRQKDRERAQKPTAPPIHSCA